MISASKSNLSQNNLKILGPKKCKNVCESPPLYGAIQIECDILGGGRFDKVAKPTILMFIICYNDL